MKSTFIYIFCIIWICEACVSSKKWQESQYLLHKQEITGNKKLSSENLYTLLRQKPNRRILLMTPYLWVYYRGKKVHNPDRIKEKIAQKEEKFNHLIQKYENKSNSKQAERLGKRKEKKITRMNKAIEEGNWLMRSVGEKPVFFDSIIALETREEMLKYLQIKGYFQGKVDAKTRKNKSKRISINYQITENAPTFLGNIEYITDNSQIDSILKAHQNETLLKTGDNYDEGKFAAELLRIETLLRNTGYLYFNRQYVEFSIDTLHFAQNQIKADSIAKDSISNLTLERKANVKVQINNPSRQKHRAFTIDNVYFHVVNQSRRFKDKQDTIQSPNSEIKYVYTGRRLNYSYRVLDRRIKIRPAQTYNQNKTLETQRSLGILDMFKFVNLNPDTTAGPLNMNIFTTPMERYQLTDEIGLNVVQGLPGPFISISLKNRNTFGGLEIFENSFRFSIDGQTGFASSNQFYSSQEIGVNSSLTFPRLLFPRKLIYRQLRDFIEDYNPNTKLSLGYNFIRRPEYTRTNLTASIAYKGQLRYATYNLTLAELSVVNTSNISNSFNQQLLELSSQGNPIIQSFDRALVSSMYFIYTFNNNIGNESKKSHYIRILVEMGGLTQSLLKKSPLVQDNRIFGLKLFQYWRVNPTFHYYLPLNKKSTLMAFRINGGIANPWGSSTTLPYEKFFFSGGGNSIRAWQPRRLGPGAYTPPIKENGNFDYSFEQPGEVILEANVEYRFPIFGYVRGALFLDAGNVWSIGADPNRPGGDFHFNSFLQQIALGSGFGIRLNLPFLVLRFDLGLKVYDPARKSTNPWVIREFKPLDPFSNGLMLLNIGIGYPF